jgi:hypothetical protein
MSEQTSGWIEKNWSSLEGIIFQQDQPWKFEFDGGVEQWKAIQTNIVLDQAIFAAITRPSTTAGQS